MRIVWALLMGSEVVIEFVVGLQVRVGRSRAV